MTTEKSTLDKITGWAADKYTAAAPSLTGAMSGGGASTATPTATSGPTGLLAAASTSSTPKVDVSSWYRTAIGRDGDAGGIAFWESQLAKPGANAEELYGEFQKAAGVNKEVVKPTAWAQANSYKGPMSTDGSTTVDDWGRNVLGRNLTGAEQTEWKQKLDAAGTPDGARAVYQQFLEANAGKIKNALDMNAASQISPGRDAGDAAYTIDKSELSRRTIDKSTETVQGQLAGLLAADGKVLQQARAEGQRTAFDRGLGNSSIAASAGEDALIRAATGIATTDAGAYNKAADYNVAAENQLLMYNADQLNEFRKLEKQYGAEEAARMMQLKIAEMNDATNRYSTDKNAQTQANQLAQQMTIAQMNDATQRWQQEQQNANSRYNTDLNYKKDVDNQKLGVANNIIGNMELSPDRKAAMLEQLGFGTMAKNGQPGTGLAGAVFVLDSVGAELGGGGGGSGLIAGGIGDGKSWPSGHTIPSWAVPTSPDYDGQRVAQYWASAVVN